MDVDALLQSHGEDAPSGEDLEYDPVFTDLEIAAQHGEERQVGDEIIAGEDPDYKEVSAKALVVLGRSHDLRAAIYLAEAQLRLKGLPGFAEATTYINRCLSEYWDSCHPQLDADDDDDPTMRVNAVLMLTDTARILRGLRRAPLTASRTFGALSLRHIEVAEGEGTAPADLDGVPDSSAVAAAFKDTDPEKLAGIAAAAATALSDVQAISDTFDERTPGRGPELDPLIKVLKKISARLTGATGGAAPQTEADVDDTTEGPAPSGGGGGGGGGAVGGINSPNDVRNAIDRIVAYYQRHEPSSPVPVILGRARKLVGADFMTIVQDMAPDGMRNVNLVGGIDESSGSTYYDDDDD